MKKPKSIQDLMDESSPIAQIGLEDVQRLIEKWIEYMDYKYKNNLVVGVTLRFLKEKLHGNYKDEK